MAQLSDLKPKFSSACGGNIRIELQETDCAGQARTLFDFFMPRSVFMEAVKDATLFIAALQRKDAENYIASLPKGRVGKG